MFRMIAVALLLSGAGVALASDASYDQQQIRNEKAAPAPRDAGTKSDTPSPMTACTCQHGHS